MKKIILFTMFFTIALCSSIAAQDGDFRSQRLDNFADQLKRLTVDLSERTYDGFKRGSANSRSDVDELFLANQLDSSAGLFQDMVRDNRSASELREAASILSELARRAPGYGSNSNLWRDAKNAVDDIQRELGGRGNSGGNDGGNNGDPGGNRSGKAFWKGTVDNNVQLIVRGRNIETQTVVGRSYPAGTFSFTSPLPNRNVDVKVEKKNGRGSVRIIQQPNRSNDFTAIIEIIDNGSGAKSYQLEISW
jgi:hypothetical protein